MDKKSELRRLCTKYLRDKMRLNTKLEELRKRFLADIAKVEKGGKDGN